MLVEGDIREVSVAGQSWYALPDSLELLNKPLARSRAKILSPFDNLLIQRKRTRALFGFDYQLECYVPAAKRKHGYSVLPILWDGKLVARMDCKAERKTGVLHIHKLILEPDMRKQDEFNSALNREMDAFLRFNNCHSLRGL